MSVKVREYIHDDYLACRRLWVELTEAHRRLYDDATIGGNDPGNGLDAYLADEERRYTCVAETGGSVVGLSGLLDHGSSAEIEPVVVSGGSRRQGIGRMLIDHVVGVASGWACDYVVLRPVARNVTAIRSFHDAGFRTLGGRIDLTMDLGPRRHTWNDGVELHKLTFKY